MTPRSFWTILIKLTGIYVAVGSFTTAWKSMNIVIIYSSLSSLINRSNFYFNSVELVMVTTILLFLIYILLSYCCLFQTDWIIDKLKLDKGFHDERFEFNLRHSTILKIATIITGGLLLGTVLPNLISDIVTYFQKADKYTAAEYYRNMVYIVVNIIKIAIGFFMVIRSNSIVNFIERRSKETTPDDVQNAEPLL